MFFTELDSLFRYILESNRVLVYGNLGRLPHVVVDYLSNHHSNLKIFFVSPRYTLSIPNHVQQFREIDYRKIRNAKCDLLVFLEPLDHSVVQANYPGAGSVVLFTSHAVLDVFQTIDTAIYFESTTNRMDGIPRLLAKLEGSEENSNVQIAKNHVAHPSVLTIGPDSHCDVVLGTGKAPVSPPSSGDPFYVVVDLTGVTQPLSIFLGYLDAFDYMLEHSDIVERWSVCFGRGGIRKYENFVQECIDRLHCATNFRPHLKQLLRLLSFYKSGTIDTVYDVPISRFVRHEYVAPVSLDEAFKSAIAHDTQQLVGGVLSIIK